MSERQLPITQIDELWKVASTRWGDPGRRNPPPDKRFAELRDYLNKIEKLFGIDVPKTSHPLEVQWPKKALKRKIEAPIDDEDDDPPF